MSLTVELADATFPKLVQAALVEMCGCQAVAVDTSTGTVSVGSMNCSCYCDHPAGCNLLADLISDTRPIMIWYSADSSGYQNNDVWWSTDVSDFGDEDVCGGTKIGPSILLAHELVHARHDSYSEDFAVRGENQIRLERCMPMRTEYSLEVVPDFRVGVLDATIRPAYGCTCSMWRGGIFNTLVRVFCRLRSMYCFPYMASLFTWRSVRLKQASTMSNANFQAGGSQDIHDRIAKARRVRTRIPLAKDVDDAPPLFSAPTWHVELENIGLDGMYRALVIAVQGDEVKVLTNFTLRQGATPYLGSPGRELVLYHGTSQRLVDAIVARLSSMQFSDGPGGPASAGDGAVHFLTIRSAARTAATQLYFYHYPATSNRWQQPDGVDDTRWQAISDVYDLWREIVTDPVVTTP